MKDILETIVKHLVENQDALKITEVTKPENENLIEFKVNVAKEDMGKIIGKQGKNARAIRTILFFRLMLLLCLLVLHHFLSIFLLFLFDYLESAEFLTILFVKCVGNELNCCFFFVRYFINTETIHSAKTTIAIPEIR